MTISDIRSLYQAASRNEIIDAYRTLDIEAADPRKSDDSLLHIACTFADAQAVGILLERGMNANVRNRYGQTPLHALAALDDRYKAFDAQVVRECADKLFDAGASAIRKDEDLGETPLTLAAKNGRFELIESACAHGAKISLANKNGNNPLHAACEYVRHTITSASYARSDEEKATAARLLDNYEKCVKALLDGGLEADGKNDQNKSALDLAIESKADRIALVLNGCDTADMNSPEAKTAGMTLEQAVVNKSLEAVRANVELGADINCLINEGNFKDMTPLAVACYTFNLPMVELLLELGADPNFKDASGRTAPAKWFAYLGDFHFNGKAADEKIPAQILKALFAKGMEKNAIINDRSDTLLLGACATADTGRGYNDVRLGSALAKALIAAKCDPNVSNLEGVTPLMKLCEKNDDAISSLLCDLLDAGADVNAVDKNGNTALHYAAQNKSANAAVEYAELLFEQGFNQVSAVNNEGKTGLEIATENDNEPLVKLLLQY